MDSIKAILFDLDGTLIDSEKFHFDCWNGFLAQYNVKLDLQDWLNNYAGIPLPQNAKAIVDKYSIETDLESFISKREQITVDGFKKTAIELMPFALDFIQFFYNKGLTLAVVTASPRADVEAVFDRNGLRKYFSLFITRTDVSKSKPDPESYDLCVERLAIPKDQCIVLEDTLNGVKAAVAAGITCFAVQSNTNAHQSLSIANQVFLNLAAAKEFIIQNT